MIEKIKEKLSSIVFGHEKAIEQLIIALISSGHVLLEGPPGVGKTLLARTAASLFDLKFRRVQMTPDLMPADILGLSIWQPKKEEFTFREGPIFTDLLLADELNRAPARTQSALLEAMQERQVTLEGDSHTLSPFFTVIATQNPFEYEGTYGLPEAELDRFMMKITLDMPTKEASRKLLAMAAKSAKSYPDVEPFISREVLEGLQESVRQVLVSEEIFSYIADLMHLSHSFADFGQGASPRSAVLLLQASKGHAFVQGRDFVLPEDVQAVALPVLGHRMALTADAKIDGVSMDRAFDQFIQQVAVPR